MDPNDPRVDRLAQALSRLHGQIHLAQEAHGLHLYMASPKCLEEDGAVELNKRHLTINLDRYFGEGNFAGRKNYNPDASALCHKTDTKYFVSRLLTMAPLADRGIRAEVQASVTIRAPEERAKFCIPAADGSLVPDHPGMVVPITGIN